MSSSNRPAIAAEIQAALRQWGPMTSAKLSEFVPSAEDREIISKVIYQLKTNGIIEKDQEIPGAPGRGAKTVAVWRLAKLTTKEEPMPSVHMRFPATSQSISNKWARVTDLPSVDKDFTLPPNIEFRTEELAPCDGMTGNQYEAINAAEPLPAEKAAMLNGTWTEDNPFGTPEIATDPTEEALSDLVDQADEAVLAMADSLLSDHPVWSRLRALQADAFQALCDWRVRSYLESFENQEPKK